MTNRVCIWDPAEPQYGALSNLFARPIEVNGVHYRSAEHAIKALQARNDEVRSWILNAPSPALAAAAGGALTAAESVDGWDEIKLDVMGRILEAKFSQHEDLAMLLLSTGDRAIVELALTDDEVNRFWSEIEGSGAGENWLGRMLMEVRTKLRANCG